MTDKSPQICRPYLTARSHVHPYLDPYYDTYAAPYVDLARPYADKLNTRVISPASRFSKKSYDLYAAPRIDQAKVYGLAQWKAIAVPKLQEAQTQANQVYKTHLGPHVDKVYTLVEPHYGVAKENVVYIHEKHVVPAVEYSKPVASQALSASQKFALETALPFSRSTWSSIVLFVDGTLWPTVASLYRQNVEPQLVLIGERLARYREGRRLKAAMDEVKVDEVYTDTAAATESATGVEAESTAEESAAAGAVEEAPAAQSSMTSQEKIDAARPQVAKDLHEWQEKFAAAADKGADDLRERVEEIMSGLVKSEVHGIAAGLVKSLNISGDKEIERVKSKLVSIVGKLPENPDSLALESAESEVFGAIREAGATVKSHAQRLRQWYNIFDGVVNQRIQDVASSTIQVLDGIRDLGLQQIGMRWAWIDGITYKDWEKYHELKKQFADWREEVVDVAFKHQRFEEAKSSANDMVAEGMDTAEKVAIELMRLKEVGKWKIQARDTSDNFESRAIPAAAVKAKDSVANAASKASESLSETVIGTSQGSAESIISRATEGASEVGSSISSAVAPQGTPDIAGQASLVSSGVSSSASQATDVVSEKLDRAVSSASSAFVGEKPTTERLASSASSLSDVAASSASEILEAASSTVSEAATTASSKFIPGAMAQSVKGNGGPILDDVFDDSDGPAFSEKVESVVEAAGDRFAEVTKAVSEALLGATQTQGTAESVASLASERYSSAIDAASRALYGTPTGTVESIASGASDKYREAVAA